jgi:hypothetical protein
MLQLKILEVDVHVKSFIYIACLTLGFHDNDGANHLAHNDLLWLLIDSFGNFPFPGALVPDPTCANSMRSTLSGGSAI